MSYERSPQADAIQWALDQVGDTNKNGQPWNQEERNYMQELKQLQSKYTWPHHRAYKKPTA